MRQLRWILLCLALGCTRPAPPSPDILLVTIDTLRADRVGCYGYAPTQTPVMDRLAREGIRFELCQSVAPITLVAHASIFTGLWPHHHGVRNNGTYRLPDSVPTLTERLHAAGYATGASVAALPVSRRFGLARGFDHYEDDLPREAGFHMPERPAAAVNAGLERWLGSIPPDQPVFAWAHYFEPHFPYTPPSPFHDAPDPYDGEVAAADAALGALLQAWDGVRSRPRIVVVTSDHGEGLGEHDEDSHTLFVYQTTQRVPLIVSGAGIDARVEATPVSLVDLAPTILSLAGAAPLEPDGQPVIPRAPVDRALLSETLYPLEVYGWSPSFASLEGTRKVIRSARPRAFDLAGDPGELDNRADEAWAVEQLARLDAVVGSADAVIGAGRTVSAQEAEALASLGYAGGAPASTSAGWLEETRMRPDAADQLGEFHAIAGAENLISAGEAVEAYRVLGEIIATNPESFWGHFRAGEAALAMAEPETALGSFRRAAELRPAWVPAHLHVARIEREADNLGAAIVAYEQALQHHPGDHRTWLEFMGAVEEAGRAFTWEWPDLKPRHARGLWDAQHRRSPDPSLARAVARARYWASRSRWSNVERVLGPWTQATNPEVFWLRGYARFLSGDTGGAVEDLRRALALDASFHEAHNLMAWIQATRLGDVAAAEVHAREAIALFEQEPEYHDTLVEVFLRQGRRDLAREHLTQLPASVRNLSPLTTRGSDLTP